MKREMTKSLPISKRMVWNSYLKVVSKDGAAGIDQESIEMFNVNMKDNLYKLWNRMASGSYFPPPVRTVQIRKKQGGWRPLGIPTVSDRIAQGVAKDYLEPEMERIFHNSSYGYRPGRSAHQALVQCQAHCKEYAWVIDVDIKGFFDNLSHPILMGLLQQHTQEKWVLMYVERWLKAGVEQEDGSIAARTKGTPQGGVASPLLANLYLHYCFDMWMQEHHPGNPFERYADDIVIHCRSKEEAEQLLGVLHQRMEEFELTLHPEKTKIVYCKNRQRPGRHEHERFTFLSYSFQPRIKSDLFGRKKVFLSFEGAISYEAKIRIRRAIREILNPRWTDSTLEWFAIKLNPKIRGWINYYTRLNRWDALRVFSYLNELIMKWLRNKYKLRSMRKLHVKMKAVQSECPNLFYHWIKGVRT
jgi:group II intron reverse transcriptase/maturase